MGIYEKQHEGMRGSMRRNYDAEEVKPPKMHKSLEKLDEKDGTDDNKVSVSAVKKAAKKEGYSVVDRKKDVAKKMFKPEMGSAFTQMPGENFSSDKKKMAKKMSGDKHLFMRQQDALKRKDSKSYNALSIKRGENYLKK